MQVSDSPAAPAPVPGSRDEVRAAGDGRAQAGRPRARTGFRDALERKRRGSIAGDEASEAAASAAAMAGWFRPEAPSAAAGAPATARTTAVAGSRAVDRVLIGSGPDGAQARIRIGGGALAGTEIQLSSAAGGHAVEARLLTHAASS